MRTIRLTLWGVLTLPVLLWLAADPQVFDPPTFFALRASMVQGTGLVAMACMSVAMILALRPRWPEPWFHGLDKMYRLHKWLGIAALIVSVAHWLWVKGPKWAVQLGWLTRPQRGPRPTPDTAIEQIFVSLRGIAEDIGEWAFYAAIALIVVALIKRFPYGVFFKTHRLLAIAYGVLVFHGVVLTKFVYWSQPVGWIMVPLLVAGSWAALVVTARKVAVGRQVQGRISDLIYYDGVRVLEVRVNVAVGWPGHKAGQFAFVTADPQEGAHPYTIASAWNGNDTDIRFIVKELGDHTRRLRKTLTVDQPVMVEGPYGCFTFDDDRPSQIWVGAGIGITPFIARMHHLAAHDSAKTPDQHIHLFHTTTEVDQQALDKLQADAQQANITLHVSISQRDGRLTGQHIRNMVPQWRDASLWFCGPAAFGLALRQDFADHGLPVQQRFQQELFAMR